MRELTFFGHATTQDGMRTPADSLAAAGTIILQGNWSTGLLTNGHRHSLNFVGADWMAFDVDGGLPLHSAQDIMRGSGLAYIIGTTASHQKAKGDKPPADRYRIVVRLASRITDPAVWRTTYDGLATRLGLPADPQARDAVRYWKPCKTIAVANEGADVVPVEPRQDDEDPGERPTGLLYDMPRAITDAQTWEPAIQGKGGSNVLWALALRLVRGYGLPVENAVAVLQLHYNDRCEPPWSVDELWHKCQDAEDNGTATWGYMFYRGNAPEVLRRALRKYGKLGTQGVPYRVFPDGSMVRLLADDAICQAIDSISIAAGAGSPPVPVLRDSLEWWEKKVEPCADQPTAVTLEGGVPALVRLHLEEGPTPAWDEFLTRLDDPETFLAWLWMLTLPKASRQILWIRGDGMDGKSVVGSALVRIFGQAAQAVTDESFETDARRWLTGALFGCRLVIVDDTKRSKLLQSGSIHRITGGGTVSAEDKGRAQYTFEVNTAVFVTSNYSPEVGRNRADRSRLLSLNVRGAGHAADARWIDRLVEEFPRLLTRARAAYVRLAVVFGEAELRLSPQVEKNLGLSHEEDDETYEAILARMFVVLDPAGELPADDWGRRLRDAGLHVGKDAFLIGKLKRWLLERGATLESRGHEKVRVWKGVRQK